jgi:hypothetical protein
VICAAVAVTTRHKLGLLAIGVRHPDRLSARDNSVFTPVGAADAHVGPVVTGIFGQVRARGSLAEKPFYKLPARQTRDETLQAGGFWEAGDVALFLLRPD